jgi:hypothetical protein
VDRSCDPHRGGGSIVTRRRIDETTLRWTRSRGSVRATRRAAAPEDGVSTPVVAPGATGSPSQRESPAQRTSTSAFDCEAPRLSMPAHHVSVHAGAPCRPSDHRVRPCPLPRRGRSKSVHQRRRHVRAPWQLRAPERRRSPPEKGGRSASEQHFRLSDRAQRRSLPRTVRVLRTLASRRPGMGPVLFLATECGG